MSERPSPPEDAVPSAPIRTSWQSPGYGWFGEMVSAFRAADIFDRFTESEREALARVAAERIGQVQARKCDARYLPRPGVDLRCERNGGHPGGHWATTPDGRPDPSLSPPTAQAGEA